MLWIREGESDLATHGAYSQEKSGIPTTQDPPFHCSPKSASIRNQSTEAATVMVGVSQGLPSKLVLRRAARFSEQEVILQITSRADSNCYIKC